MSPKNRPIRIGLLGFEGVKALDLTGPMDAFYAASSATVPALRNPGYEQRVIGITDKPFSSDSGLMMRPHQTIEDPVDFDTLIVPGGPGSRNPAIREILSPWIAAVTPKVRRLASVCTGIYLVAPTGVLDGRDVTTHWLYCADVKRRFPRLRVQGNSIYLKSDKYYTSAGITAGIDLTLALIEEDYGSDLAMRAARELVVYFKRSGGQRQFSEPLRMQEISGHKLSGLLTWLAGNLDKELSVEVLADRAGVGRRQLTRLFQETFGAPPAEIVEDLRLEQARELLSDPTSNVKSVASAVGFRNPDSFRRAFIRRFGIAPSVYREPEGWKDRRPCS